MLYGILSGMHVHVCMFMAFILSRNVLIDLDLSNRDITDMFSQVRKCSFVIFELFFIFLVRFIQKLRSLVLKKIKHIFVN